LFSIFHSRLLRAVPLLVLLVAPFTQALSFGSLPQLGASASQLAATSDQLSRKNRIELFDDVWEIINEKYYDPTFNGVNWQEIRNRYRPLLDTAQTDDEFYGLLKRMVGELHDAHTRFHTPRERREREHLQAVSAGVSVFDIEGKIVVVGVDPTSDAARAGVEAGMIVRAIDGRPVEEKVAEARTRIGGTSTERAARLRLYRKLTEGEPDTALTLGLLDKEGKSLEVRLTRRVVPDTPSVAHRRLQSGYGYIRLNLWKSPINKEFKKAVEQLKDAPGLIIDLRGNPGGEANEVVKIASFFFSDKVSFGKFISRSGKSIELVTDDDEMIYSGPLVILMNEASGSGSELFAASMRESGRAVVVGRQSCGCVLGISRFRKVEGGGELAVSELGYLSPKGNKLEGTGIIPDELITLRIADLQNKRDAVIEGAENRLRSNVKSSSEQN
jgi:carboxyl-terminal processing protease